MTRLVLVLPLMLCLLAGCSREQISYDAGYSDGQSSVREALCSQASTKEKINEFKKGYEAAIKKCKGAKRAD